MRRQTSVRVEDKFYKESKKVFDKLGLSFGDAVNLFLAEVALKKKIPFEVGVPSEELGDRIDNLEHDENVEIYDSVKELFERLGI
ncbi:MAG: type II toxin-antitoxin system antitoxin, RelB/DinJ family [Thermotoga sp.]|nr:MAG: type II toxin-antitoxin system antitoxin, RelB/DinJ family [Thermotoga sp.]